MQRHRYLCDLWSKLRVHLPSCKLQSVSCCACTHGIPSKVKNEVTLQADNARDKTLWIMRKHSGSATHAPPCLKGWQVNGWLGNTLMDRRQDSGPGPSRSASPAPTLHAHHVARPHLNPPPAKAPIPRHTNHTLPSTQPTQPLHPLRADFNDFAPINSMCPPTFIAHNTHTHTRAHTHTHTRAQHIPQQVACVQRSQLSRSRKLHLRPRARVGNAGYQQQAGHPLPD
jgi:hypothetical protein